MPDSERRDRSSLGRVLIIASFFVNVISTAKLRQLTNKIIERTKEKKEVVMSSFQPV